MEYLNLLHLKIMEIIISNFNPTKGSSERNLLIVLLSKHWTNKKKKTEFFTDGNPP